MPPKTHATLQDVARLAGVSTKSISRVMNGEPGVSEATRQRIQEAIADLGYVANHAARRLRGGSNVIGLIVSGFDEYAGQMLLGMSGSAQQLGYNLVLYVQNSATGAQGPYETLIASGLVSGMLLMVPFDEAILIGLCNEYELPYVLIDYQGREPAENVPTVTVTNRKGVHEAPRYLLSLGHRRIGFITGLMTMASAGERLQGYKDGLEESGIAYDPGLVTEGDWSQKTGFIQTKILLLRQPDLTAIICSDDLTAFGAMDAIKDVGLKVGEDISVIGFDDIPRAANVHPPLTTIRQPMEQMGAATVEMLAAMLEKRPRMNLRREFSTELIIRQSTRQPSKRTDN